MGDRVACRDCGHRIWVPAVVAQTMGDVPPLICEECDAPIGDKWRGGSAGQTCEISGCGRSPARRQDVCMPHLNGSWANDE